MDNHKTYQSFTSLFDRRRISGVERFDLRECRLEGQAFLGPKTKYIYMYKLSVVKQSSSLKISESYFVSLEFLFSSLSIKSTFFNIFVIFR